MARTAPKTREYALLCRFDDAIIAGDVAEASGLVSGNFQWIAVSVPGLRNGETITGRPGLAAAIRGWHQRYSELRLTGRGCICAGELIFSTFTLLGRHHDGPAFHLHCSDMLVIHAGQLVRRRSCWTLIGSAQKLWH